VQKCIKMCIVKIYMNLDKFVNVYKKGRDRTCPITVPHPVLKANNGGGLTY